MTEPREFTNAEPNRGATPAPAQAEPSGPPEAPRWSRRAVASLVVAIATVTGLIVLGAAAADPSAPQGWETVVALAIVIGLLAATVLGILGLVHVRRSRGAVRGGGSALAALVLAGALLAFGIAGVVASQGNAVLMRDDFEGAHLWTEDDDPLVTQRYANGGYEVTIKNAESPQVSRHFFRSPSRSHLTFSADATVVRAEGTQYVGVLCWSNADQGYLFVLSPIDGYAILRLDQDGRPTLVREGAEGPDLNEGDTVRLSIECTGGGDAASEIVVGVDGRELARAKDATEGLDGFTAVGLWSATQNAGGTIRWDNALAEV